jgi:hypothetical protein
MYRKEHKDINEVYSEVEYYVVDCFVVLSTTFYSHGNFCCRNISSTLSCSVLIIFQVSALFEDHHDLLDEFARFLPDTSATPITHTVPYARNSNQHYNERNSTSPSARQTQIDKVITYSLFFLFIGNSRLINLL